MEHKDAEHDLKLEQMKAQMQASLAPKDTRGDDQKLKHAEDLHKEKLSREKIGTKTQAQIAAEKVKQAKFKPKPEANKPKPKEKK
jgi:hypothetical protein